MTPDCWVLQASIGGEIMRWVQVRDLPEVQQMIAEEREACAKVADSYYGAHDCSDHDEPKCVEVRIAEEIRARGNQ